MNEKLLEQVVSAAAVEQSLETIVEKSHYLDHLKKVNDVFYDQIKIADQKAAYLFTFIVAFLVTSAEVRGVFDDTRYTSGEWLVAVISAVMGAAVILTLVAAIMVVLPRSAANGTSLYWGSWPDNRERFVRADRSGDPAYLTEQYLGNVDNLAVIAHRKFFYVALAFRGLLVTVAAYVALLAIAQ